MKIKETEPLCGSVSLPRILSKDNVNILHQELRQPGRQLRDESQNSYHGDHHEPEGKNSLYYFRHASVRTDALNDKEVHAYRRGNQGQLHVDNQDDGKPDGIEAETHDQGIQDRHRDQNDRHRFQNAAEKAKQEVDGQEHDPAVHIKTRDKFREFLRQPQYGQDKPKQHGANDNSEDHGIGPDSIQQDVRHVAPGEGPIYNKSDEETVHYSHRRRFRRSESAGIDAADDEKGKKQAPAGFFRPSILSDQGAGSCGGRFFAANRTT